MQAYLNALSSLGGKFISYMMTLLVTMLLSAGCTSSHALPRVPNGQNWHMQSARPAPPASRVPQAPLRQIAVIPAASTPPLMTPLMTAPVFNAGAHPEGTPFFEGAPARAQLEGALRHARIQNKLALVVMGANWCHDSRAFAGWMQSPQFSSLLAQNYIPVYIDVGQKNRNIDIAQRFGLPTIEGTPTVFIIAPSGQVLNLPTAPSWRNAASRAPEQIYAYLADFAGLAR